jgi:multidrug efflux pump subunit AcrA (membrane-fusion protein)
MKTNAAAGGVIELQPVQVKVGISDGNFTEVLEGLKEGDVVVSGVAPSSTGAAVAGANQPRSPFGGPFGGPGRPR